MLENGGNFENDIPIPDYRIHLVLDRISYEWSWKIVAILKTFEFFIVLITLNLNSKWSKCKIYLQLIFIWLTAAILTQTVVSKSLLWP